MSEAFKDHFSAIATSYASYRPTYPPVLFDRLAALVARRTLAWDCATGSGQAARALAERFERVIATDGSAQQLAQAPAHPRITYRVARAEASSLDDASVDLVTVAQALHWFELDKFYAEARRVLVPDGVLAVWSYGDPTLDFAPTDAVLQPFLKVIAGPFWPPESAATENGYRDYPFPFRELPQPAMELTMDWTLAQVIGYARTWSATRRMQAAGKGDAVTQFVTELTRAWGDPNLIRRMSWPLGMRVGKRSAVP